MQRAWADAAAELERRGPGDAASPRLRGPAAHGSVTRMADGNASSWVPVPLVESTLGPLVGTIVAHDQHGVWVEFPGNTRGPIIARLAVSLEPAAVAEAIASARGVLLTFEQSRSELPIVLGLLQDQLRPLRAEAEVDGERVEIVGKDEIVLRCGLASITLRRNGRVVIRGVHVETRASGVNRIRGGSVAIN